MITFAERSWEHCIFVYERPFTPPWVRHRRHDIIWSGLYVHNTRTTTSHTSAVVCSALMKWWAWTNHSMSLAYSENYSLFFRHCSVVFEQKTFIKRRAKLNNAFPKIQPSLLKRSSQCSEPEISKSPNVLPSKFAISNFRIPNVVWLWNKIVHSFKNKLCIFKFSN